MTASLPVWGVWIEIHIPQHFPARCRSLPVRGVWIEIEEFEEDVLDFIVAPRKGSVD